MKTPKTPVFTTRCYHYHQNKKNQVLCRSKTQKASTGRFWRCVVSLCVFQRPVNDEKSPVGPWLLALFVFVVCGSGEFIPCRWYRCWYSCWCRRALLPAQLILSLWRFCRTLSALETLSHIFPQKFCLQPAGYGVRRSSCDRLHFYRCQSGLAISN